MGKRITIVALLIVAAVAAAFLLRCSICARYRVGQVLWQTGSFAAQPHVNPLRCKKIAILTPSVTPRMDQLQMTVAKELVHRLREKDPTLNVATYSDLAAAKGAKCGYYVRVVPLEWRTSLVPLSRSWQASVLFEGSPDGKAVKPLRAGHQPVPSEANVTFGETPPGADPALLRSALKRGREDYKDLHLQVDAQGKVTGIISASRLASEVADSIVEPVIKEMERDGREPPTRTRRHRLGHSETVPQASITMLELVQQP